MRFAAFAFVIFLSTAAAAVELDTPPISAQAPGVTPSETCVLEAKRGLTDYFRKEFNAEAFVDMQPILAAERAKPLLRAFYFWVRAATEDAKQYRAGTARVVVSADSKCDVTGFISKADILASRAQLTKYFPPELIPKILWFAETPQK
jgi:hypothetical protein